MVQVATPPILSAETMMEKATSDSRRLALKSALADELTGLVPQLLRIHSPLMDSLAKNCFDLGVVEHAYWWDKLSAQEKEYQTRSYAMSLRAHLGQALLYSDEWVSLVLAARAAAEKSGREVDSAVDPIGKLMLARDVEEMRQDNEKLRRVFAEKLADTVLVHAPLAKSKRKYDELAQSAARQMNHFLLCVLRDEFGDMQVIPKNVSAELGVYKHICDDLVLSICVDRAAIRRGKVSIWPIAIAHTKYDDLDINIETLDGLVSFLTPFKGYAECEAMIRCMCFVLKQLLPLIEPALIRARKRVNQEPLSVPGAG